jgi:hypothetical protein
VDEKSGWEVTLFACLPISALGCKC